MRRWRPWNRSEPTSAPTSDTTATPWMATACWRSYRTSRTRWRACDDGRLDSTRRIDILLGGVRAAIRRADEAFRPDPDAALYVGTDDGRINLADLLALAPAGMDPGDFERRVSTLYNGDGEQRRRMLDHWDDPDYMYDLVCEVEDSGMRSPMTCSSARTGTNERRPADEWNALP